MSHELAILDGLYPSQSTPDIQAAWGNLSLGGGYTPIYMRPFDGEHTLGGLGPATVNVLDHDTLRIRSWEMMLSSELVQIGIARLAMWEIGAGLDLRYEPKKNVLKNCGIEVDTATFAKEVEDLFNLYANSPISDYAGMESLHMQFGRAKINALVGGDCLMIINFNADGLPVLTVKDGAHVQTPMIDAVAKNGNRIKNGVEINDKGQQVAYYVRKGNAYTNDVEDWNNYERIPARYPNGYIRAFLYYGLRYRLDDIRGIPLITVCMETCKQLDLYKEATVAGAVERAKIVLYAKHELAATGQNPFDAQLAKAIGNQFADLPRTMNGTELSNTVIATTNKQFVNMPNGAELKAIESKQEIQFSEFYDTNMTVLFAALGIPKEIALTLFSSNYSASRASIKDFEHTLAVNRKLNDDPAYSNFFNVFFLVQVLQGTIKAPGYLDAIGLGTKKRPNSWAIKLAYENTAWLGDNPPNIDELKEVMAARLKLGEGSKHIPLARIQNVMTDLGEKGDIEAIMDEYNRVMEYAEELGIEPVEKGTEPPEDDGMKDNKENPPMPKKPKKGKTK